MTRKSKPTIRERAAECICPECNRPVERTSAKGRFPVYCSKACKVTRGNRRLVRGSAVIEFLQAWRVDRGNGEIARESLAQICQIVDGFNAEDLAAGRPRADLAAAKILVQQTSYADRAHK